MLCLRSSTICHQIQVPGTLMKSKSLPCTQFFSILGGRCRCFEGEKKIRSINPAGNPTDHSRVSTRWVSVEETGMTKGRKGQGERSQSSWVSVPHLDSDSGPRNANEGSEPHRSQAGFPSGTERCRVSTHGGLSAGLLHTHSSRKHRPTQVLLPLHTALSPSSQPHLLPLR